MIYRTSWHRPVMTALPKALADWLTYPGSLTRQLQHYFEAVSVSVLTEHWQKPLVDEAQLLHQALYRYAYQRKVFLMSAQQPLVYAKTVVPRSTYDTLPQRFSGLGNRPLGEMLFNHPSVKRGEIQVALLSNSHPFYQAASQQLSELPDQLWARRSCFYLANQPLLVNEVFLPSRDWSAM